MWPGALQIKFPSTLLVKLVIIYRQNHQKTSRGHFSALIILQHVALNEGTSLPHTRFGLVLCSVLIHSCFCLTCMWDINHAHLGVESLLLTRLPAIWSWLLERDNWCGFGGRPRNELSRVTWGVCPTVLSERLWKQGSVHFVELELEWIWLSYIFFLPASLMQNQ